MYIFTKVCQINVCCISMCICMCICNLDEFVYVVCTHNMHVFEFCNMSIICMYLMVPYIILWFFSNFYGTIARLDGRNLVLLRKVYIS